MALHNSTSDGSLLFANIANKPQQVKATATLGTLPLDIALVILTCCEPLDILSLRKCNSNLLEASRQRTIWINIARWVCSQYDVLSSTFFSLEEMSLAQLERAATSSSLVKSLLRNHNSTILHPLRTIKMGGAFLKAQLLPGGRFLLTLSLSKLLELRDLGFASKMPEWRPLAWLQLGSSTFDVRSCPSKGCHLLLVSYFARYEVFEIDPTSSICFALVGKLDLRGMSICSSSASYTDRLHVVPCIDGPVLWDWKQDTWIQLKVEDSVIRSQASGEYVITIHIDKISVWTIPMIFYAQTRGQKVPLANTEPLATYSYPGILCSKSHIFWRETASWPLQFDIYRHYLNDSHGSEVHQFQVDATSSSSSLDVHHTLTLTRRLSLSRPSQEFELHAMVPACRPQSYLVTWMDFVFGDDRKCFGQLIEHLDRSKVSETLVDFTTEDINGFHTFYLDPFSGRACALLAGAIVIMDYLKSSE